MTSVVMTTVLKKSFGDIHSLLNNAFQVSLSKHGKVISFRSAWNCEFSTDKVIHGNLHLETDATIETTRILKDMVEENDPPAQQQRQASQVDASSSTILRSDTFAINADGAKSPNAIPKPHVSALQEIFCGSMAGMTSKLVEHPFDTIKVRLQTQTTLSPTTASSATSSLPPPKIFSGPWDCFRKTVKMEGFAGLYQGICSPLFGSMMENAVLFFAYNRIQSYMSSYAYGNVISRHEITSIPLPIPHLAAAGAISGGVVSFILTPVELIKCNMQVRQLRTGTYTKTQKSLKNVPKGPGAFDLIFQVYRQSGITGLYRGQLWTFVRETGGGAAWFGTYEWTCRFFQFYKYYREQGETLLNSVTAASHRALISPLKIYGMKNMNTDMMQNIYDKDQLSPAHLIVAGGLAGIAYNVTFFPADVIKSISQTHAGPQKNLSSSLSIAKEVLRRDGWLGFYRGLGITVVRAVPSNAVIFLTYEMMRRWTSNFSF